MKTVSEIADASEEPFHGMFLVPRNTTNVTSLSNMTSFSNVSVVPLTDDLNLGTEEEAFGEMTAPKSLLGVLVFNWLHTIGRH